MAVGTDGTVVFGRGRSHGKLYAVRTTLGGLAATFERLEASSRKIPRLARGPNRWAQNTRLCILHSTGRQGTWSVGTHLKYSAPEVAVSIQEFFL